MIEKEAIYVGHLLNLKRQHDPQPDCKINSCCGICDKFYPCLYDSLDQIQEWSKQSQIEFREFLEDNKNDE